MNGFHSHLQHQWLFLAIMVYLGALSLFGADERLAMVIGNNQYRINPLENCVNDARLIAAALEKSGFRVTKLEDATRAIMQASLDAWKAELPTSCNAVVYFAGHGIEVDGKNYLLGVNARLEAQSQIKSEAVLAQDFADAMVKAQAKSILFLDCCRNKPEDPFWNTRSAAKRGLASMTVGGDIFICFSTLPGKVAADTWEENGQQRYSANSPYAYALAALIPEGLKPLELIDQTDAEVRRLTKGLQQTWHSGSMNEPLFFTPSRFTSNHSQLARSEDTWKNISFQSSAVMAFIQSSLRSSSWMQMLTVILATGLLFWILWIVFHLRAKKVVEKQATVDGAIKASKKEIRPTKESKSTKEQASNIQASDHSTKNKPIAQGNRAGDRAKLTLPGGVPMDFCWCPAGSFMMGEKGEQISVRLMQGFWMARTSVTQEQWEVVMGNNPSHFKGKRLPVENVSWKDTQDFLARVRLNGGGKPLEKWELALPTEAQWEYGCRAGTTTEFWWGNSCNGLECNCDGNNPHSTKLIGPYLEKTSEVNSYQENPWGLCDMHGNVWEWCLDWYADELKGGIHPKGPSSGSSKVNRGGSWLNIASYCRAGFRRSNAPDNRYFNMGFRPVLVSSV